MEKKTDPNGVQLDADGKKIPSVMDKLIFAKKLSDLCEAVDFFGFWKRENIQPPGPHFVQIINAAAALDDIIAKAAREIPEDVPGVPSAMELIIGRNGPAKA